MTVSATAYCVSADLASRLGDDLKLLLTDDDQGGTVNGSGTESTAVAKCITKASEKVLFKCAGRYSDAQLATSQFVTELTADLATFYLYKRRGNTPPESIEQEYEFAMEMLDDIYAGRARIPGISSNNVAAPVFDNHRVEQYPVRKSRVEPIIGPDFPQPQHVQATSRGAENDLEV